MRTKVRGPESHELALELTKKKRKIEQWPFFKRLVLAYTIELMDDLCLVRLIITSAGLLYLRDLFP